MKDIDYISTLISDFLTCALSLSIFSILFQIPFNMAISKIIPLFFMIQILKKV